MFFVRSRLEFFDYIVEKKRVSLAHAICSYLINYISTWPTALLMKRKKVIRAISLQRVIMKASANNMA